MYHISEAVAVSISAIAPKPVFPVWVSNVLAISENVEKLLLGTPKVQIPH